jgi:hypothetical protein
MLKPSALNCRSSSTSHLSNSATPERQWAAAPVTPVTHRPTIKAGTFRLVRMG